MRKYYKSKNEYQTQINLIVSTCKTPSEFIKAFKNFVINFKEPKRFDEHLIEEMFLAGLLKTPNYKWLNGKNNKLHSYFTEYYWLWHKRPSYHFKDSPFEIISNIIKSNPRLYINGATQYQPEVIIEQEKYMQTLMKFLKKEKLISALLCLTIRNQEKITIMEWIRLERIPFETIKYFIRQEYDAKENREYFYRTLKPNAQQKARISDIIKKEFKKYKMPKV